MRRQRWQKPTNKHLERVTGRQTDKKENPRPCPITPPVVSAPPSSEKTTVILIKKKENNGEMRVTPPLIPLQARPNALGDKGVRRVRQGEACAKGSTLRSDEMPRIGLVVFISLGWWAGDEDGGMGCAKRQAKPQPGAPAPQGKCHKANAAHPIPFCPAFSRASFIISLSLSHHLPGREFFLCALPV